MVTAALRKDEIVRLFGTLDEALVEEILATRAQPGDLLDVAVWLEMSDSPSENSVTPFSRKAERVKAILLRDACTGSPA